MVDVNNQQADGPRAKVMGFRAAGADKMGRPSAGTCSASTATTCRPWWPRSTPRAHTGPKPRVILCDTKMGKGVPFLEAREKNHFIRVDAHEWQLALAALDEGARR
jgi:transketolase